MSGSSFLTFGLTYWEGVGAATAGFFLVSIFMALNGRPGAFWHIPFPVAARASWGVIGFSFACLNRAFMACFWNASESSFVSNEPPRDVLPLKLFPLTALCRSQLIPPVARNVFTS